jgi:hypothetical protein
MILQGVAAAQVTTADIVGRITDTTGAVLPGATVTSANPNLNFGTAGFGSVASTGNAIPRQIQFAAKLFF